MSGSRKGGHLALSAGAVGATKAHDALRILDALVLEKWTSAMVDSDTSEILEFVALAKGLRRTDSLLPQ